MIERANRKASCCARVRAHSGPLRHFVALLILIVSFLFLAGPLNAAPDVPVPGKRIPPLQRTNVVNAAPAPGPGRPVPPPNPAISAGKTTPGKTNAPAIASKAGKTNAPGIASKAGTNAPPSLVQSIRNLPSNRAFYPVVIGLIVCVIGLLFFWSMKPKAGKGEAAGDLALVTPARPVTKRGGKGFHSCTVLQVTPAARKVWQFDSRFALNRDQTSLPGEPLPASTTKSWRSLFQRKLNIAWLSPEDVFLRVAQFPASDFNETLNMVELQLERLSPMPVTQIVWSLQVLPNPDGKMQTAIVMMVARSVVEEFLGNLEGQGYLADRVELPLLDQLQATKITENGAWIYPEPAGGRNAALVAWWYGDVLQSLNLITKPAERPAESLSEQLMQGAWAGEMDGWLTSPPRWHLVAEPVTVAEWEPPLREGLGQPLDIIAPLPPAAVAGLTARRAAQAESAANLLPAEFATRYQQQFVDRLWMRGLGAVVVLYLIGLLIYGVAVGFAGYRTGQVEQQVAALGPTYTNVIKLKAQYDILKERQELKYAGLDCWKAVAELMPDSITLDSLVFSEGRKLTLHGTAPADQTAKLNTFDAALRRKTVGDKDGSRQLLFETFGESISWQTSAPGTVRWNVTLQLKRTEEV
jgi:hypothetical protein